MVEKFIGSSLCNIIEEFINDEYKSYCIKSKHEILTLKLVDSYDDKVRIFSYLKDKKVGILVINYDIVNNIFEGDGDIAIAGVDFVNEINTKLKVVLRKYKLNKCS
jgi:hypothetical protein